VAITAAEESEAQKISIYPNPTQDWIYIKVKSSNDDVSAQLVSATGLEMESKTLAGERGLKEGQFELNAYASGIYYVRISDGSKVYIKKIAKVD
jgi:hypothetical protein